MAASKIFNAFKQLFTKYLPGSEAGRDLYGRFREYFRKEEERKKSEERKKAEGSDLGEDSIEVDDNGDRAEIKAVEQANQQGEADPIWKKVLNIIKKQ